MNIPGGSAKWTWSNAKSGLNEGSENAHLAFGDGYAGGPVCGCLIKRNLSQAVSKACRQTEGAVFRNGPFAKGVSLPEWGQFELESGQFGPESIVQHHAAVYDPLHPALLL